MASPLQIFFFPFGSWEHPFPPLSCPKSCQMWQQVYGIILKGFPSKRKTIRSLISTIIFFSFLLGGRVVLFSVSPFQFLCVAFFVFFCFVCFQSSIFFMFLMVWTHGHSLPNRKKWVMFATWLRKYHVVMTINCSLLFSSQFTCTLCELNQGGAEHENV